MKIIFICGSLEPGKDGVGDYTRRLCGALLKQGVSVGMLAYNDKYVLNKISDFQVYENFKIPSLRLPNKWKSKARCKEAKTWIELHNPEWLSLQFVIYAYHKKGLPFSLAPQLKEMGGSRKWHIMFHELWLGLKKNDSFKYRVIGFIQKSIVTSIKNKINFKIVHTHSQFYLIELSSIGLKPLYLSIFSNIPFNETLSRNGIVDENQITFVMFGTIHPNAPVKLFAKEMFSYFSSNNEYSCNLIIIGKTGVEQNNWVKEFNLLGMHVSVYGELNAGDISCYLQNASFGITTNPIFVIEKSGTVAAMREHGLPIIIVAENTSPKKNYKFNFDSDLIEYKMGNLSKIMSKKYVKVSHKGVSEVSRQFLKDILMEELTPNNK